MTVDSHWALTLYIEWYNSNSNRFWYVKKKIHVGIPRENEIEFNAKMSNLKSMKELHLNYIRFVLLDKKVGFWHDPSLDDPRLLAELFRFKSLVSVYIGNVLHRRNDTHAIHQSHWTLSSYSWSDKGKCI